jgi:putative acyl-CoA dehydrogenase
MDPNHASTHEVFNQSTPLADLNLYTLNRPLQDALAFHASELDCSRLHSLGAQAGSSAMQQHAVLANRHTPRLHTHDAVGRRIDSVEFHPSYHALMAAALHHGLHGAPWSAAPGGHIERAAGFMLATELEPAVLCPVSMSYAATPALRGNAALQSFWGPRLAHRQYDAHDVAAQEKAAVTLGMGMTEKQGGSDVRANTSHAVFDGEDAWGRRFRLTGHKWFFSAPMCDAHLVLAKTDAGPSCFLLPRRLPDGSRNALQIQRLKDKLGNRANASAEVEFRDAAAWLVGEEGRGVPQILAMGALTRLDCALGTAGLMRQALSLALHHCAQRRAFGKTLIDHAAMRNVLADLALESEAATALALRLARAVDRCEHGRDSDGHEALLRRLLTPIAKFWVCKRGSLFAQEAMECLGGNGYVEAGGTGVMARIYREMPVNSIWEGAGNIQALDLLRVLQVRGLRDALAAELAPARGRLAGYDTAVAQLLHTLADASVRPLPESQARQLAQGLACALQASLLGQHAPTEVFEAFCASRLAESPPAVFGCLPYGAPLDALIARASPDPLPSQG